MVSYNGITHRPNYARKRGAPRQRYLLLSLLVMEPKSLAATQKFCVIADAPYNDQQARILDDQMRKKIPSDCSFLLHLGDYRKAGPPCTLEQFQNVANILKKSPVPVFPLLGDNDSVDCPNFAEGLQYWRDTFDNFAFSSPWTNTLTVEYQPDRVENPNFVIRLGDSLIFGLTILGGSQPDIETDGLIKQLDWVKQVIRNHVATLSGVNKVGRIVLACQADPGSASAVFFDPFADFIRDEIGNRTPVLLLHGDSHVWDYEPMFYDQPSYLRINIAGETIEPPTIIRINESGQNEPTNVAFQYDRQFPTCRFLLFFPGVSISRFIFGTFCITLCEPWWQWKVDNMDYFVGTCPE